MTENNLVLNDTSFINVNIDETNINMENISYGETRFSPAKVNMIAEGSENYSE